MNPEYRDEESHNSRKSSVTPKPPTSGLRAVGSSEEQDSAWAVSDFWILGTPPVAGYGPQVEVAICHLPPALHIPLKFLEWRNAGKLKTPRRRNRGRETGTQEVKALPIYVICKLSDYFPKAVNCLQSETATQELESLTVQDVARASWTRLAKSVKHLQHRGGWYSLT